MQKHKFDTRTETKSSLSRQVLEGQRNEHEAQDARLPQGGPFEPLISGIGDASSAGVHASMLNRATNGRPFRAGQSLLRLQRQYGNRYVQRVLALAGKGIGEAEAAPEVEQNIQQARGGGHGIDSRVRGQMESAFSADFGNVRLHTDAKADTLNRELNARAFTTGQDIFFRQDAYNPGNSSGRELIAHELTHVVQQNGDKVQRKLTVGQPGDKYEQEADQVARAVMQQEQRSVQRDSDKGFVRRQIEEEEDEIQMKSEYSRVQQQVEEEEEEPVQSKVEDAWVQRQTEEEEEEPVQAKAGDLLIRRQFEEEPVQARAETDVVQRQIEGEKVEEAESGGRHEAAREILEGAIQNLAEDLVEKAVPPAKYAIIAGKLAMAFGEGIGKGLQDARQKLASRYDRITRKVLGGGRVKRTGEGAPGLTEEDKEKLQYLRRWQANSAGELNSIIEEGLRSMVKEAIDIVSEGLAGRIVEGPLKDIGKAIGDFAGDVLTGDYVGMIDFISQAAENRVQETIKHVVGAIGSAFAKSTASYAVKAGMTELESRALLEERGLPGKEAKTTAAGLAAQAAKEMLLEVVGRDVKQKVEAGATLVRRSREGRQYMRHQYSGPKKWEEGWKKEYKRFEDAYRPLIDHNRELEGMNFLEKLVSEKDEELAAKLNKLAREARGALFGLGNLYFPRNVTHLSFEWDMEVIFGFARSL